MATCHNINRLALEDLTSNVKILKMIHEPRKLSIYEALVIIDKKPALNRQVDNFINPLKLFGRSYNNHETFVAAHTSTGTRVDGYVNTNAAPSRSAVTVTMGATLSLCSVFSKFRRCAHWPCYVSSPKKAYHEIKTAPLN